LDSKTRFKKHKLLSIMKKQILLAALTIMSAQLFAQEISNEQPSSRKISHSAYGALSTKFTRFNGENAIVTGAYGGWMINHKLMLGAGGYALVTSHDGYGFNESNIQNKLRMGYAGFVGEYTFLEKKRIHASANLLLGAGAVVNGYIPSGGHLEDLESEDESGFLVVEPTVSIETDVTKWFRVGVGAGYRLIGSSEMTGITDRQLSGATANVTLKFGIF
jgi:hypothetical protein